MKARPVQEGTHIHTRNLPVSTNTLNTITFFLFHKFNAHVRLSPLLTHHHYHLQHHIACLLFLVFSIVNFSSQFSFCFSLAFSEAQLEVSLERKDEGFCGKGKDGKPSVGPVYRNLLSKNQYPPVDPDMATSWDLFSVSVKKFPGNKMLEWRKVADVKVGPYVSKTYKGLYDDVLQIGSALRASGAEPGTYGANCPQWIVAMEACNAHSLVCVPLYDTLGPGAVNFIIDHADVDYFFVQDKKVKELLKSECRSAERLKKEEKDKAAQMGIKSYSWEEFLHMGKENASQVFPPQPFSICTIMYTSGTSGDPKGVMLMHETVATLVGGIDLFMDLFEDKMTVDDVYPATCPYPRTHD